MYANLKIYLDALVDDYASIPEERKLLLKKLSDYIINHKALGKPVNLLYICTHNSRRSHFGQVWAKVAADYYQIKNIDAFSGGTEVTAFHPNAIHALKRTGLVITPMNNDQNTVFNVLYDDSQQPIACFSKMYDDKINPLTKFAAIMTCSDAEQNCPFIPGVEIRISTTYDDPKVFDNTLEQDLKYDERCRQIAMETLYVFSVVNKFNRLYS